MKSILFSFIFIFFVLNCFSQYFNTGQDPDTIKWRQINTDNFQVIYPAEYESKAQRLSSVLEKVYDYGSYSLTHKPKKISLILHTHNNKSNGLVAIAPKRAEFFTIPDQTIYPQDWLDQLVLHEFRHVVQIDKISSELPGIIKYLLGEQGIALAMGSYLPFWFIEGDAVATETALSSSGRGRFSSFLMETRAQLVEKGIYSLDKAYNGSFKDFVPNHYNLGYFLVGGARERYGASLWENVLKNVGSKPLSFTPFNTSVKEQTGMNQVYLYKTIFDSLRNVWTAEDNLYKPESYSVLTGQTGTFTSYAYNHYLNDTVIITYKTSFKTIPAFIKVDRAGKEKVLFVPGKIFGESIAYGGNLIVWSERLPDVRWAHSGESLIRIYDVLKGKIKEFKTGVTSTAPAVSIGNEKIALVETDQHNEHSISIYTIDGQRVSKFRTSDNNYFFSPCWLDEDNLAVIILGENGKRLAFMNLKTGNLDFIKTPDLVDIKQLHFSGGFLYFISSYSGRNELYAMNIADKEIFRICSSRFGSDYPSVNEKNGKILLSDYTANGYRLIIIPNKSGSRIPIHFIRKGNYKMAESLAAQEKGIPDFTVPDTLKYPSRKYSKIGHLFHFHSWAPVFIDVNNYSVSPGISFMSQNKLGTTESILGYKWNTYEKTGQYHGSFSFKGWYPTFTFEANSGKRASDYYLVTETKDRNGNIIRRDTTVERFSWNQSDFSLNTMLPLNLTRGKNNRFFQPGIIYELSSIRHNPSTIESFFQGDIQSLYYNVYYHQLLSQSYQDVYPDLGVILDLKFRHTVGGNRDLGNLFSAQSILYIPGFMVTHGIRIYGGLQKKNPGKDYHSFNDLIRYPRGWSKTSTTEMISLGVDYKLPLLYPDWNLGKLWYIQRVKCSLFGDYAYLKGNIYKKGIPVDTFIKNISSFGMELTGDMNLLRLYFPIDLGLRAGYMPERGEAFVNFLLSVNFQSF